MLIRSVAASSLDAIVSAAMVAAEQSANTVEPSVFCPPICTFSNPNQARTADLANGLALSVELDDVDPDAARARLEGVLGRATVVSYSGSDWVNPVTGEIKPKIHIHWRLSEPTLDERDHMRLRQARELATVLVGADPTAKPVVHPLRWPGSWNCKTTPRLSTIAAYDAAAEINLSEALEALETAIEAAGWTSADMPGEPATPEADIAVVQSAMAMIPNIADDVHYGMWVRLGYAVHRATGGTAEGFGVWDTWSKTSDKYDADETFRTWRRIRAALSGKNPPRTIGAGTIFYLAAQHGWIRQPPLFEHSQARAREAEAESDDDEPESADDSAGEQKRQRPRILSLAELDALPPPEWIIRDLIPEAGFVVPYGPPKSGKTFVMLIAGLHVAAGRPWCGKPVKQGAVVYIAGEGTGGLSLRLKAMRQHYGIAVDVPFWVVPRAVNFQDKDAVSRLADDIRSVAGNTPIRMIFLDTLARAMPGADENSA